MTIEVEPAELWASFRREERPVLALLKHVSAHATPSLELHRLVASLTAAEATALHQVIEDEKVHRDAWLGRHPESESTG